MTGGGSSQGQRCIRNIQRTLRRLEGVLREMESQAPEPRPADSRSELLEQIHVAGAMEQCRLFELLDQRNLNHTWIGAQVGSEYLELWQDADGRTFYRVTPRAVRELHLGQLASAAAFADLSEAGLEDDWLSEEDSVYDRL